MKISRMFSLFTLTTMLCSCGGSNDSHHHHTDSDALLTENGVWPPVLVGVENEQALEGTALAGARESVIDAMRSSVLNNPEVKQALGSNYREFEATLADAKSENTATFLFYNYETDTTVEAIFTDDGTTQLTSTAATLFQPAEHAEEIPLAIGLASDTLVGDGYDLSGLTGSALLAHPPIAQSGNASGSFFEQRILYVTFGPGDGEIPHYSALVNLSTSSVSDAKLIN